MKFIFTISDQRIEEMMKESGVDYKNPLARLYFLVSESVGGKMDFSMYHLSVEVSRANNYNELEPDEILKDKGPIFIIGSSATAYNLMDTGNWLWGNANNRLGNSAPKTLQLATMYNIKDSNGDKRAIVSGWYYQAGFRISATSNK